MALTAVGQSTVQGRHATYDERRAFQVPVEGGVWITVAGPFPITDTQWDQFMHVLEVMRPGLVKELP